MPGESLADEQALCARVVDALAAGQIVGWMQGPVELGPRALGNRSILAAPHDAATRDRLNLRIKLREEFRPFAPAVTAASAERHCGFTGNTPDMNRASRAPPSGSSK